MAQRDKSWENAWKSALDSKSITPPEEVWDTIAKELDKPRRQYLQPIWWAAATISIIAVAGILLTERIPADQQGIEFKVEIGEINKGGSMADAIVPEHPIAKKTIAGNNNKSLKGNKNIALFDGERKENPGNTEYQNEYKNSNRNPADKNVVYDFIPGLIEGMKAVVTDLKLPEVGKIWGVPMAFNTIKKAPKSNWYAGLDLSTGSSSGTSDGSVSTDRMAPLQTTFSQADNSSSSVTSSTAYGITVGKKVTKKIIFETGLSYSRLSGTGTTNIAITSVSGREAFNYNASTKDASLTTTSPYNVEHVHQFISIPVKAGYLILDRQWKLSLNAGVAGDYFLKTHTADLSGDLQMYEANPATDPQWNSVSMSLLGEINVSRQLGRHYLIAITPQMRHSVNDLSNTSTELRPSIFQVGIQLKYQF